MQQIFNPFYFQDWNITSSNKLLYVSFDVRSKSLVIYHSKRRWFLKSLIIWMEKYVVHFVNWEWIIFFRTHNYSWKLIYNLYQMLSISTSTKGIVMHRTIKQEMFRRFERLNKKVCRSSWFSSTILSLAKYSCSTAHEISSKPLLTKPVSQDGWMLAWHFFANLRTLAPSQTIYM